jgi:pimeloyl-ACP methyl ester carboxylesterase
VDTINLMDYISAYAFPNSEYKINDHMVLGVSLGGHAAWQCLLFEPRISTAVIIIGCPDYTRLLIDRARLSKLKTWIASEPPGSQFLGSKDFPTGLMEAVEKWDPRGLFCKPLTRAKPGEPLPEPSDKEKASLRPLIENSLGGKRILNLSGGRDKLVPYAASEPFLNWLKKAIGADGWYHGRGVSLDDIVFDGVGHEMTPAMVREAVKFLGESLSNPGTGLGAARGQVRDFKM